MSGECVGTDGGLKVSALKGIDWPWALMAEGFCQGGAFKLPDVGKECS